MVRLMQILIMTGDLTSVVNNVNETAFCLKQQPGN